MPLKKRAFYTRLVQYIRLCQTQGEHLQAGYQIRTLLYRLCQDKKLWKQVEKQEDFGEIAIEVFEDLKFLHEPHYQFLIKFKGDQLIAPEYKSGKVPFGEVTFDQWKIIDGKFTKFLCLAHQKNAQEARVELGKFLSAIYSPKLPSIGGAGGGLMWSEENLENSGYILRTLQSWQIDLILETYGHIRNYVIQRYPHVFPTPPLEGTGEESSPVYSGQMWQSMHYDVADTEAFKGYELAGKSRMHDVLGYLDKKLADQKKLTKEHAA